MKAVKEPCRDVADFYDTHDILDEIDENEPVFSLDENLRNDIVGGKRHRKMQNVSIRLDPALLTATKKIATARTIPYQILIRQWLADAIRHELKLA